MTSTKTSLKASPGRFSPRSIVDTRTGIQLRMANSVRLFTRDRTSLQIHSTLPSTQGLFAVRVDGTGWRRLRQQQPSSLLHNDLCVGVASNDWIVFRRDIPATTSLAGSTPPTTELYALRTDGSGEEHLLVDGGSFTYEGSSPAQRIVYASRVGPTKTLYSVNVDDTHAKEIYSQTGPGFVGVSGFTSQNRAIVNMGGEGLVGIDVFDGNRSSLSEGLVSVRVLGILCPARFGKRTPCGMNWQLVEPAYFFE